MNQPISRRSVFGLLGAPAGTTPLHSGRSAQTMRVLTFNIWNSGGTSLDRTIEAIRAAQPDIVGLQECNPTVAKAIAKSLGFQASTDNHYNAILSPHPLNLIGETTNMWGGMGVEMLCPVKPENETSDSPPLLEAISFFNAHLHWDYYGPYWWRWGYPVETLISNENSTRMPGLQELFTLMRPSIRKQQITLLVGDFNAPSHLDYSNVPWSTSVACDAEGLSDSYRIANTGHRKCSLEDPFGANEPGVTWTPITDEEPLDAYDRIDYIYYFGANKLSVVKSITLDGTNSVSPWPSDHRAVLTEFRLDHTLPRF